MSRNFTATSLGTLLLVISVSLVMPVAAGAPHPLLQLSLEELFAVEITSVSRKPQSYADVASAIYVITAEDIHRSSADSLPELLMLAPGVDVRRIDASHWAVSVRGFNGEFANKLLVLLDGVAVYTPTFSGVNWDEQDIDLAEIERIEVIRGPGAATWGVNAVNGVINIVTRGGEDQSRRVSLSYGDNLRPKVSLASGGELGKIRYRASGQFRSNGNSDGERDNGNTAAFDKWISRRGELHASMPIAGGDAVELLVRGWNVQQQLISDILFPVPPVSRRPEGGAESRGATVLLELDQQRSWGERNWQIYYDDRSRDEERYDTSTQTVDLQFTELRQGSGSRELVWGLGYRHQHNRSRSSYSVSVLPEVINEDLFTAFFQQSWRFLEQRLELTLGSKFEQSSRADFNVQPSLKASYRLGPDHTVWASISRAVRTPSLIETHGRLITGLFAETPLPLFGSFNGNSDVGEEKLDAYELGWRRRFGSRLAVDGTLFLHDFDQLIGVNVPTAPVLTLNPVPHGLFHFNFDNIDDSKTYGLELAVSWQASQRWRLRAHYSWMEMDGIDALQAIIQQQPPEQLMMLNSNLDIADNWELDASLRFNDNYPVLDIGNSWVFDLRLAWHPTPGLEVILVAKDLLDREHFQFNDAVSTESSSVGRTFFCKVDWYF